MTVLVGRRTPRRWMVMVWAIIAGAVAVALPSAAQPVEAGGAGAEIGMPFTGWWDRFGIAHPSYHGPSGNSSADWAIDLYQAAGTAVRPRMSGPGLALKVASVGTTCGTAGKTVKIDVHTNNEWVGSVRYGHLANVQVSAGQWISPSTVIGYLSQWSWQAGCWEVTTSAGVHTHFTSYNNRDYSCYYDKGSGASLSDGTGIGIVGGAYGSGVRSRCSQTLPRNDNPIGSFDTVSASAGRVRVRGWTFDPNAPTSAIRVHVYVGGRAGSGATGYDIGYANLRRDDVARAHPAAGPNHGFDTTLDTSRSGSTEVCAYGINIGAGSNSLLGCKTVNIPAITYEASFVDQHAFRDPALSKPWDLSKAIPGQEGWLRFRVRNTGTATWSNSGSYPVRLGTQQPQDRSSAFRTDDWYSPNRPTAMSESTVGPGGTATFVFEVRVPEGNISTREHFRVVAESRTWFGPTMWRDVSAPDCAGQRPTIVGTVGPEAVDGTSGDDVIATFGGRDTVKGLGGDDLICTGGGSDVVFGQGGRDVMFGQRGNDSLVGAAGDDTHNGGPGRDVAKFNGARNRVVVDLVQQTATGWGRDRVIGVENVVGSPQNDVLRGKVGPNRLVGANGNDTLVGRGGSDALLGGKGADVLKGGPQRDVCNGQLGRDRAFGCEVRRSIP